MEGFSVRVPVPTVRIDQCSQSLYQAPQTSYGPPTTERDLHLYVHVYVVRLLYQSPLSYIGIGYITRCRSLRDLYTEGRRPRGCINPVETEPSDITNLYHGLRGHNNASSP